ncbi:MAG: hypothetical protein Q7K57_55090 [Burkholderiaceae bacterium]|nr:hypothetical protein [Burkholderiaceae bacterium]
MGPFDLANHLINFVMPALAMGVMMPLVSHMMWRKVSIKPSLKAQMSITTLACLAVLIAGLVIFGNDGKMATYAGLILAGAVCQWWFQGGWRIK